MEHYDETRQGQVYPEAVAVNPDFRQSYIDQRTRKAMSLSPGTTETYLPTKYRFFAKKENQERQNYNSNLSPLISSIQNIHREHWSTLDRNNGVDHTKIVNIKKTLDFRLSDSAALNARASDKMDVCSIQHVYVYYCGSCLAQYDSVSSLHDHLQSHTEGGSYFYNHHTRTAFPKFDSVCKDTQTIQLLNEDLINGRSDSEVIESEQNGDIDANSNKPVDVDNIDRDDYFLLDNNTSSSYANEKEKSVTPETIETKEGESCEPFCEEIDKHTEVKYEVDTVVDDDSENDDDDNDNNDDDESYQKSDNDSFEDADEYIPSKIKKSKKNKLKKKSTPTRGRPPTKDASVNCKICQQKFKHKTLLKRHVKKDHKNLKFVCVQCSKQLETEEELQNHRKIEHAKTFHQCELCNKVLCSKMVLEDHYLVHKGIKPFTCDICQRPFTRLSSLRCHMQIHSEVQNLLCDYCGKAFSSRQRMLNHVRHCGNIKPYKCDFCDMGFVSNYCLQRHRRKHTGEKPFVCEVCAYASSYRNLLIQHMRIHTGEKPYKCKFCPQSFSVPCALKKHIRTHTKEKPYVCSFCSKGFTQRWNLKTHERQHTGETPYKCKVCGMGYKQNVLLKTHMKTHYPEVVSLQTVEAGLDIQR